MSETNSLRPEDIEVQTFAPLTAPGFWMIDEDPTDPADGHPVIVLLPGGHIGRG